MGHVYAIKLQSWTVPSLMELSERTGWLHYLGMPQNIGPYNPEYHEIVLDYGEVEWNDIDAYEALEVRYAHDYPPEIGLRDSEGWLAPDGKFFPCRSWEHDSTAFHVYRYVYDKAPSSSAVSEMEQRGWVRIYANVFRNKKELTQAQLDTLWDLAQITENEQLKTIIGWQFD